MTPPRAQTPPKPRRIMLYERRSEGHHLSWLRFITEDLLSAGFELCLAVSQAEHLKERLAAHLGPVLHQVRLIDSDCASSAIQSLARLRADTNAEIVFLTSLDEIASRCCRRAAFGWMPPAILKGRLGGIYFRPRVLAGGGFGTWIKARGMRRLLKASWFSQVLLLDEFLTETAKTLFPKAPFCFLPDVWPNDFERSREPARQALQISPRQKVFLFYGGPYRRKGMRVAVRAFLAAPHEKDWLLICAGRQPDEPAMASRLRELERRGQAKSLNRYISDEEEKLCFAAADFVLLPYIQHFGSSGVLSRAAGAGRLVLASDEGLVGRRVRGYGLGLLFESGSHLDLLRAMRAAVSMPPEERRAFEATLRHYAESCTRERFRAALLRSFGIDLASTSQGP